MRLRAMATPLQALAFQHGRRASERLTKVRNQGLHPVKAVLSGRMA